MNLLPLVEHLTKNKVGAPGKTLFINMIPIGAPSGVLLRNPLTGTKIDHELPGFYKTTFTVIVRSTDYEKGEVKTEEVASCLNLSETTIGDIHIKYCRPRSEPVPYPLSLGNLIEFAIEYDVCYYKVSS